LNKKILITTLGLASLVGLGVLGTSAVKAADTTSYPPMVQVLVDKFGLNADEVQTVFEENRQARQGEMLQNREERLNQAVEDGAITAEQKDAIANKWQEMEQERQEHREEMQAWFDEQGIDHTALMQYGGFGPHGGFGKGFGGR
jgi:hypothetical protein